MLLANAKRRPNGLLDAHTAYEWRTVTLEIWNYFSIYSSTTKPSTVPPISINSVAASASLT